MALYQFPYLVFGKKISYVPAFVVFNPAPYHYNIHNVAAVEEYRINIVRTAGGYCYLVVFYLYHAFPSDVTMGANRMSLDRLPFRGNLFSIAFWMILLTFSLARGL